MELGVGVGGQASRSQGSGPALSLTAGIPGVPVTQGARAALSVKHRG